MQSKIARFSSTGRGKGAARVVAVVVIVVVLTVIAAAGYFLPPFLNEVFPRPSTSVTSSLSTTSGTAQSNRSSVSETSSTSKSVSVITSQGWPPQNPLIANGSARIGFPADYNQLANYSLSLINYDRAKFGLGPVTLSSSLAGQQHADSMLYFGYIAHWDAQGFKPYMRYTLLGGKGAVAENVAMESWTGPHFLTTRSVEIGLNGSESSMMYNDSACCNNDHRLNILDGLHNRVSIGVAYNTTHLFFVEDFENYYINMNFSVTGQNVQVKLSGTPLETVSSSHLLVFFDGLPVPLTRNELNNGPRSYSPGNFTGAVFQPCPLLVCPIYPNKVNVYATVWQVTSTRVDIEFALNPFVIQFGRGVYTLYLVRGDNSTRLLSSLSVFVGS